MALVSKDQSSGKPGRLKKTLYVLTILLAIPLVGIVIYRQLTHVRVVSVSSREISEIAGADTLWTPPRLAASVSGTMLVELAADPTAGKVTNFYHVAKLASHGAEITGVSRVTDAITKSTQGRTLVSLETAFGKMRKIARVYAVQIAYDAEIKNHVSCIRAASEAISFYNLMLGSFRNDLADLVECRLTEQILLLALERAAAKGVFTSPELIALYKQIEPAPPVDRQLADVARHEFTTHELPALLELQRDPRAIDALFMKQASESDADDLMSGELNMPATVRLAVALTREQIDNCARSWKGQSLTTAIQIYRAGKRIPAMPMIRPSDGWFANTMKKERFRKELRAVPNAIGLMAASLVAGLDDQLAASFLDRTRIEAFRLMILIQAYRQENGSKLPATLDQLHGLEKSKPFPQDLYFGGPFHYSSERKMFWSVGRNGIDNGGVGSNVPTALDIVWSLK